MQTTYAAIKALHSVSLVAYIYSIRGDMETITDPRNEGDFALRPNDVLNNVITSALRADFRTSTDITDFKIETLDGITFHYSASIVRASEITPYKVVGTARLYAQSYMIDGVAATPIWRVTTYLNIQWAMDERQSS